MNSLRCFFKLRWAVPNGPMLTALALSCLLAPLPAAAQQKSLKAQTELLNSGEPIRISSDRMELDQKARTIAFVGQVVVRQGKLTITGRRLTVYAEQGSGLARDQMVEQIDRIEMQGDVKVTQEDKVATAGKAVFYNKEQKIILSDQPRLAQGNDHVEGTLITLFLDQEKSIIEGSSSQPVQALLHPKQKK